MSKANIGWSFYRSYYKALKDINDLKKINFNNESNRISEVRLPLALIGSLPDLQDGSPFGSGRESNKRSANDRWELYTTYPGLLIGSGYQHESGGENEFKIGFFFDYTTGLPQIPGSSVKGVLRSS